jgi:pilus assembly protein CpaF
MARLRDGSRKVSSVAEVVGFTADGVELEEIFHLERGGTLVTTGYRPEFLKRLAATGVDIPEHLFLGSS